MSTHSKQSLPAIVSRLGVMAQKLSRQWAALPDLQKKRDQPSLSWRIVERVSQWRADSAGRVIFWSFVSLVLAPSIAALVYMAEFETRSYVVEMRMALRGASEPKVAVSDSSSAISKLANSGPKVSIQDVYIVLNYVRSSAIVADLGGLSYLKEFYSKPEIDYLSRLSDDTPIEGLTRYWEGRCKATVDTLSGIVTVKIEGYTPLDALKVAREVAVKSEAMVNAISLASRKDAVPRAEKDVAETAAKLASTRAQLSAYRNASGFVDPGDVAMQISQQLTALSIERSNLETTIQTLSENLDADSLPRRLNRSKLAALDSQIDELRRKLAGEHRPNSLSEKLGEYERLKLAEQFQEKLYSIALTSYYKSRQEEDKQQVYVAMVVPPILPQEATYPRIVPTEGVIFLSLFMVWSILVLTYSAVNDQRV